MGNTDTLPLVSIGIPIYNEERFLEETLRSLLAQDYPHIEFIISDNASTDATAEICRRIAALDKRITYHRFDTNRGANDNFIEVLKRAQGKYFMWAAGHDLWSSNLVSECVRLLESEPSAVIAFGSCAWVDHLGARMAKRSGWTDTRGMDATARLISVLWGNMHPMLGLMRREVISRVRILPIPGADLVLLAEMALVGDFVHATAACWSRREFRDPESYKMRMARYASRDVAIIQSLFTRLFPVLRLPFELVRSVLRSNVTTFEKVCILIALPPCMLAKLLVVRRTQI